LDPESPLSLFSKNILPLSYILLISKNNLQCIFSHAKSFLLFGQQDSIQLLILIATQHDEVLEDVLYDSFPLQAAKKKLMNDNVKADDFEISSISSEDEDDWQEDGAPEVKIKL
jgi:hypothetical protein